MPSVDTGAIRPDPEFRARQSFYHALAHAVELAPPPAGAVFESTLGEPLPLILVRPARIAEELRGSATHGWGEFRVTPPPPSPLPPTGFLSRVGVAIPQAAPQGWSPDPVPMTPESPLVPLGPEGWLSVQTFWIRTDHSRIALARRFRIGVRRRPSLRDRFDSVAETVAYEWACATGAPASVRRAGIGSARAWSLRSLAGVPRDAWLMRGADRVAATAEVRWLGARRSSTAIEGHAVVFGSSGAGKTTYLAHRTAAAISGGGCAVVIDLHGDLAPAVVARLPPRARDLLVSVDAGERPVSGIAALTGTAGDDRAAGLLVAAMKRVSADGPDLYWGFRLERIFDSFVRLVQESGGSLLDLFDLLTSGDRRDAARLATRRPELARFLEELEPVVRRNPDFLWSAATRISKVALVPALAELLAPRDGGIPVERVVGAGRSLLVRLPIAQLGPEAAGLAATLVLARCFLGIVGTEPVDLAGRSTLVVLDEVQAFSPRLVAEVLAESRKFGLRALVATQYPERLAPEVRSAAAGVSTQLVVFRVPPASAATAGAWLGLEEEPARRLLPSLAAGRAVELDPETGYLRPIGPAPSLPSAVSGVWRDAVRRTREEYGTASLTEPAANTDDPVTERLLLAVLAADEEGRPLRSVDVIPSALALPGDPVDAARLADRWSSLRSRSWVEERDGCWFLTPAGARGIGLGSPTNAARESAEHRRLLLRAFRIFARRGYRLEIVRQGRFDTTLPDAVFRQLTRGNPAASPADIGVRIDRARTGWAWRFFAGRDVFVEAEVSGALRAERIRHGMGKAFARGAYVLFVVGDAGRARRVRAVLAREEGGRDRAQVWTLSAPHVPKP